MVPIGMDDGRLPPEEISFRELRRSKVELDDEIQVERSSQRRLRNALRSVATPAYAVALIATLSFALSSIPQPPDPHTEQRIPPVASDTPSPSTAPSEQAADEPVKERPRKHSPKKKHKRIVIAADETAETHVSVSSGAPVTVPETRSEPKRKRRATDRSEEPQLPEATLLFRRLYKDRNGDHFHSVYSDKIAAKEEAGYRVREDVGYLYENEVRGTTLFTIGEGTMGWIYTEDQGKQTIPLYRLVGPDHHDNEVVFTSGEDVKTYWIGNGWREDRVVGYVVKA